VRFACVTSSWPPFQSGVSVSAVERAQGLAARGHEVLVIVPSCYDTRRAPGGVELASFPAIYVESRRSSVTIPFAGALAVRRAVARFRPDAVWLEEPEHVFLASVLGARAAVGSVPTVGMLHTDYESFLLASFPLPRVIAWITCTAAPEASICS
jgi:hypothetical protein